MSSLDGARSSLALLRDIKEFQHAIGAPERCPFPVIVAVHGLVLGLGVDIVSACDVRYAAESAQFSVKVRGVVITFPLRIEYNMVLISTLTGSRHRPRRRRWHPRLPPQDRRESLPPARVRLLRRPLLRRRRRAHGPPLTRRPRRPRRGRAGGLKAGRSHCGEEPRGGFGHEEDFAAFEGS